MVKRLPFGPWVGGLVVLLGFVVSSAAAAAPPPDPPSDSPFTDTQPLSYLAAVDRLAVGDTASAMGFLRRTLRRQPTHEPGFLLYVRLSYERRGPDETMDWIKDQLERHRSPGLLVGVLEGSSWSTGHRLELLDWAEQRGIRHPELSLIRIRLLLERGRLHEGMRRVRAALVDRPRSYPLHLLGGRVQLRRGNLEAARRLLRGAIRLRPGGPMGYYWIAKVYEEQGLEDRAHRQWQRYEELRKATPPGREEPESIRTGP